MKVKDLMTRTLSYCVPDTNLGSATELCGMRTVDAYQFYRSRGKSAA